MKYVSPKYELEVLATEDIMLISFGNGILGEMIDGGADTDDETNDVSVEIDVGNLLPNN